MPIVIREIVTEVVVRGPEATGPAEAGTSPAAASAAAGDGDAERRLEIVIRQATERVLEVLRREWEP